MVGRISRAMIALAALFVCSGQAPVPTGIYTVQNGENTDLLMNV